MKKMIIFLKAGITIATMAFVVIMVTRFVYHMCTKDYIYNGSLIIVEKFGRWSKCRIVNPNNFLEYVEFDLSNYRKKLKEDFYDIILKDDQIYLLTRGSDIKSPYHIVKIENGKMEVLPIEIANIENNSGNLLLQKDCLILNVGEKIYFISQINYKILSVYEGKKSYERVITGNNGIITVNKDNELLCVGDKKENRILKLLPGVSLCGWYKRDESFLIYDMEKEESKSINFNGEEVAYIGSHPYDILENMDDDVVVMQMLIRGYGLELELDWWDIVRKEKKSSYIPYIYNTKNKNIRNIIMEEGFRYQGWQDINFSKDHFEKIAKSLE